LTLSLSGESDSLLSEYEADLFFKLGTVETGAAAIVLFSSLFAELQQELLSFFVGILFT